MSRNLADMRRDYTRDGLSEEQAPDEPFALFHQWFAEAVRSEEGVEGTQAFVQKRKPSWSR